MEDFEDRMLGCYEPYWMRYEDKVHNRSFWIPCPCGHCINCLRNYEKAWSFRMRQEMANSRSSFFLTLTYDDNNLPYGSKPCLFKPDYQNFIKRLRKSLGTLVKLRYVCCGEYGGKTDRPHYHMALFLSQRIPYTTLYDLISEKWNKGFIQLHFLDKSRIKYLAKYFNKLDERWHDVKTFRSMSNGIGKGYLTDATIKYHKASKSTVIHRFGHTLGMPRYYKDKIFSEKDKNNFINDFNNTINDYLAAFRKRHGISQTPWQHYAENNSRALERSRIAFGSVCDDDSIM